MSDIFTAMMSAFCANSIDETHFSDVEAFMKSEQLPAQPYSLYVHVPFCAARCPFCAFYREPPHRQSLDSYLEYLALEWAIRCPPHSPEAIFFGGGTPGILAPEDWLNLRKSMGHAFAGKPLEWTVEFSPATVRREKLEVLWQLGVTRISLGVQSFQEKTLASLGRRQTEKQIFSAYELIRSYPFNVSLDLMFHIPGQTLSNWLMDLNEALALSPDHLSTYCLTVEEGTPLSEKISARTSGERFYKTTWNFLRDRGLFAFQRFRLEQRRPARLVQLQNFAGTVLRAAPRQRAPHRFDFLSDKPNIQHFFALPICPS
jgi:oxygen-independent coproporphyrinogen-3 oxidase